MLVTATHHFPVNELWVFEDLLGEAFEVVFRQHKCKLHFPADTDAFGLHGSDYLSIVGRTTVPAEGTTLTKAAVAVLAVDVEMDSQLTADDFPAGQTVDRTLVEQASALLHESAEIARSLVFFVATQARIRTHQYWLEPIAPRVIWLSRLVDAQGQRIRVGYNDPLTVHWSGEWQHALTRSELESTLELAKEEEAPPLPETLLADALFYAFRADQPNLELGLMLAAVACETKIKSVLAELAAPDQEALVDLVLENPRDVSVAAASLFDKGLAAVTGTSLRLENKDLFKAVEKLFQDRNKFAHRGGGDLDPSVITQDLHAAQRAFVWIDEMVSDRGSANAEEDSG